jgi:hypothetical protein
MVETTTFYTFPSPPPGRANRGWRRSTKAGKLLAMQYRLFPKIPELPISTLGFGCMRLPSVGGDSARIDEEAATRLVHQAIDAGVNYFDTAWPYHGLQSEPFLGRAVKGRRREVQLATKLPVWLVEQESDWERFIDGQLAKLDTARIDFYMLHGLAAGPWDKVGKLRGLRALERAKADGRIGHIGFSFHGSPDAFRTIIDGFDWEFCLIQLNYLDQQYQAGLDGLRYAESHKVGPRFAYDAFMVKTGSGADQCTECGECEPKCPQNVPIVEMLAKAHAHLTS